MLWFLLSLDGFLFGFCWVGRVIVVLIGFLLGLRGACLNAERVVLFGLLTRGLNPLLSCPFTPKVSSSRHHSRCVLAHPCLQGLIRYSLCLEDHNFLPSDCRPVWLQGLFNSTVSSKLTQQTEVLPMLLPAKLKETLHLHKHCSLLEKADGNYN